MSSSPAQQIEDVDAMVRDWSARHPKDKFPTFTESKNPSLVSYLESYAFHLHCQIEMARQAARIVDPECYQKIAAAARACGYAVALHGSCARDVDIVAVPWVEEAVDLETLADAVAKSIGGYTRGDKERKLIVVAKPHGRQSVFIFPKGGGTVIDLSVMPRTCR